MLERAVNHVTKTYFYKHYQNNMDHLALLNYQK